MATIVEKKDTDVGGFSSEVTSLKCNIMLS